MIDDEATASTLSRWLQYREQEEWLVQEIVKARGTRRSALKRVRKELLHIINNLEKDLFKEQK